MSNDTPGIDTIVKLMHWGKLGPKTRRLFAQDLDTEEERDATEDSEKHDPEFYNKTMSFLQPDSPGFTPKCILAARHKKRKALLLPPDTIPEQASIASKISDKDLTKAFGYIKEGDHQKIIENLTKIIKIIQLMSLYRMSRSTEKAITATRTKYSQYTQTPQLIPEQIQNKIKFISDTWSQLNYKNIFAQISAFKCESILSYLIWQPRHNTPPTRITGDISTDLFVKHGCELYHDDWRMRLLRNLRKNIDNPVIAPFKSAFSEFNNIQVDTPPKPNQPTDQPTELKQPLLQ